MKRKRDERRKRKILSCKKKKENVTSFPAVKKVQKQEESEKRELGKCTLIKQTAEQYACVIYK